MSNFASQGGSVQKRIITFKIVELKTKTIINKNHNQSQFLLQCNPRVLVLCRRVHGASRASIWFHFINGQSQFDK